MEYRIGREELFDRFRLWNGYLRRRVRLVACGGTALTLLGFKLSTKDVDLMVPETKEYAHYDLIITKLFRGTAVDFDDCMALAKGRRGTLDLGKLVKRFRETASYALGEDRINRNLNIFLERLEEG